MQQGGAPSISSKQPEQLNSEVKLGVWRKVPDSTVKGGTRWVKTAIKYDQDSSEYRIVHSVANEGFWNRLWARLGVSMFIKKSKVTHKFPSKVDTEKKTFDEQLKQAEDEERQVVNLANFLFHDPASIFGSNELAIGASKLSPHLLTINNLELSPDLKKRLTAFITKNSNNFQLAYKAAELRRIEKDDDKLILDVVGVILKQKAISSEDEGLLLELSKSYPKIIDTVHSHFYNSMRKTYSNQSSKDPIRSSSSPRVKNRLLNEALIFVKLGGSEKLKKVVEKSIRVVSKESVFELFFFLNNLDKQLNLLEDQLRTNVNDDGLRINIRELQKSLKEGKQQLLVSTQLQSLVENPKFETARFLWKAYTEDVLDEGKAIENLKEAINNLTKDNLSSKVKILHNLKTLVPSEKKQIFDDEIIKEIKNISKDDLSTLLNDDAVGPVLKRLFYVRTLDLIQQSSYEPQEKEELSEIAERYQDSLPHDLSSGDDLIGSLVTAIVAQRVTDENKAEIELNFKCLVFLDPKKSIDALRHHIEECIDPSLERYINPTEDPETKPPLKECLFEMIRLGVDSSSGSRYPDNVPIQIMNLLEKKFDDTQDLKKKVKCFLNLYEFFLSLIKWKKNVSNGEETLMETIDNMKVILDEGLVKLFLAIWFDEHTTRLEKIKLVLDIGAGKRSLHRRFDQSVTG